MIDQLFGGLKGTFLEGQLILGGSSGLFAFSTNAPAYTEDLDFYVNEDLVVTRGAEIVRILAELGFARQPDTPTFSGPGRPSFDLVGFSTTNPTDHLSPPGPLQVMVFGNLGIILTSPGSIARDSIGGTALSPSGFAVVKLMTLRVEKGAKDKLQALIVISERSRDISFRGRVAETLRCFDDDTRRDVLADAQIAFLALKGDPSFANHGAERYSTFLEELETGYRTLIEIVEESLHG
ncbi:MAG: hypothetical protein ACQESR_03570 [Planctomycetota bacterium]